MGIPATLSTVPAQTPYIQYVATSGQTVFPYPFEITQDSDLVAVANGTTLATDSGYTLSGVGNSTGGDLTFTSGRTAGDIITLYRDIPIERLTQFAQNGGFSSTAFNAEFNNVYLLLQQLQQNIDQCLQIPNTNNPAPMTSLTPGAYASKYLAFDANGNPEPATLTSSGTLTGSILAALLWPQTAPESAISVTPSNYADLSGVPIYDVHRYGAKGDGVTNDAAAIQAALNVANQNSGGIVRLPQSKYLIGATSLTIYPNVILEGDVTRYGGNTTRGTSVVYTGTGNAIYGKDLLDTQVRNLDVDCTQSSGTTVKGIYLNGCWKCKLENVTVRGVTPAKGFGIYLDDDAGYGAQHNYLEQCECSDGVIEFNAAGGGQEVTTTVCNTIRGMQYVVNHCQVCFINCTAESWGASGNGFTFTGGADTGGVMIFCDIENLNSGAVGISIASGCSVREFGTEWGGFSGTTRVSGVTDTVRSYGGAFTWQGVLTAATAALVRKAGDYNADNYASEYIVPTNVTGGAQTGYEQRNRLIGNVDTVCEEQRDHFRLYTTKSCTTSATAVLTIPVPSNTGIRVKVTAFGADPGNAGCITYNQECVCSNNSGTLSIATNTQLKAPNVANGISFAISSTNLIVNFANTTNTATIQFYIEIDGPITSYTKN